MNGALRWQFPDGRWHFQHGPIDLVIAVDGPSEEMALAVEQGWTRFDGLLDALVADLPVLRQPAGEVAPLLRDPAARRMAAAVYPHREKFVTPMAAVAGAVADEVLAALCRGRTLARAYVNNGGDIAFHLASGQSYAAGIVGNVDLPRLDAGTRLTADLAVRGIATSGWRGRSHSLGIADAVTVLARTAAAADVAATLIANAVNVENPEVRRVPAGELDPDSDLGGRLVTVDVGLLPDEAAMQALEAGVAAAQAMRDRGLIHAAYLQLGKKTATVGAPQAAAVAKG